MSNFGQYSKSGKGAIKGTYVIAVNGKWGIVTIGIDDIEGLKEALESLDKVIKSEEEHRNNFKNPHKVTKEQVGLGKVDNTSDKEKPISDAVKNELSAISNGYSGSYLTKALAEQDKVNIKVNSSIYITNDPNPGNNGLWNWNGSILTKSTYDPLKESKSYVDGVVRVFDSISDVPSDNYLLQRGLIKTLDDCKVLEWRDSKWDDTGLSDLDLANKLTNQEIFTRSKLIGQSIQDGYTDKYGFFVKFFELKNKVLELYQSVSTQSILTKDIYLDESDFTVTDKYGFTYSIVQKKNSNESSTDISDILFMNKIAHWSDVNFSINIAHALIDRQIQIEKKPVVLSFSGIDSEFSGTSDDVLTLPKTADLGSGVDLYFRNKNNFTDRSKLSVSVSSVPDASENKEIKILMIGDSNTYRGATAIVKHMLERRGYKPTFIGTFLGSSEKYRGETLPVQVAEARGGIGVLGFTYMSTARWHPVDNIGAGVDPKTISVDAYLALSNAARDSYNPMLRKATASDNQDFVNNGYIFDVADYLAKFNFETPDVVFISVGGNELTQAGPDDRRRLFTAGLQTMISQVTSGIPTAKILLGHNTAAYTTERDGEYWIEKVIPHFQIKRDLAFKYGATLLNTHVIANGESGYALKTKTKTKFGLELGTFQDAIHYQKGTRLEIYDYVAANIAAAKLNLI